MNPDRGTFRWLTACGGLRARLPFMLAFAVLCSFAASECRAQTERVRVGRLRVELQKVVDVTGSSLSLPLYMDTANDNSGRMFFAEKNGRLRMLQGGTFSTFLDLSAETYSVSESGLLGFTFHPDYADPLSVGYRKLYTYHSVAVNPSAPVDFTSNVGPIDHHNVVTEWKVDANNPNQIDVSTRREVFREAHVSDIHNAGAITFGPDGYLYGTIGAAPLGTSQQMSAQNNANIMGKMYRIDPIDPALTSGDDPVSANGKYRIPADNPFVSDPTALD
jgi:glucose/arabinose dehydrogenase